MPYKYSGKEKAYHKNYRETHKVPISKGGNHYYRNLGVACLPCNIGKRDKSVIKHKRYLRITKNARTV